MWHVPHILLSLVVTMTPTSLLGAEGWQAFGIKHFGFVFDVPPGFALTQRSDQGAAFEGKNNAFLAVWGAQLGEASFRAEIEHRMAVNEMDGWRLTYKRVRSQWASYSGLKDGQILYVRAIKVRDDRAALFTVKYNRDEKVPYDPIVVRMVRSLRAVGC
ncbi:MULTISPECIES: hypothetical protein [unclassified Mesorhizobium]|uniref:hypothetical protein n=1 Tax=unclassified Mesorhizobium TaxID=325217 RepID=UPI000F7611CE|nr:MULTISPECIES: hypothetical protein [unclassified Mesorhizobium]AZO55663.1 hypothetical protein EJ077_21165 [Mesorhizobium sp. M8A.F.Ca.ET.057.01.1.1]RWE42851.1 MAG: hypothetical protein EOS80_24335 [Mesorhizobium sp.]TJX80339.1 MAG: hypothetical protein E5W21_01245 [Mesorhizobium sp.]